MTPRGPGACAALLLAFMLAGCSDPEPPAHLRIEGGDVARGRTLAYEKGCGACHIIGGVPDARGVVGPSLANFAQRTMIAGRFPNAPRTLIPWLMDPPAMNAGTGMPNVGLNEAQARDIAAYLYSRGAAKADVYPDKITLPDPSRR